MKKIILTISLAMIAQVSVAAQQCDSKMTQTAPNIRFSMQANGTVKDLHTGLTWMRCPLGMQWDNANSTCSGSRQSFTWQAALTEANDINDPTLGHSLYKFAGITTWRLPNIKELMSLNEAACKEPSLNGSAFKAGFSGGYGDETLILWSNTPTATMESSKHRVWAFNTRDGDINHQAASYDKPSVLLVAEQP